MSNESDPIDLNELADLGIPEDFFEHAASLEVKADLSWLDNFDPIYPSFDESRLYPDVDTYTSYRREDYALIHSALINLLNRRQTEAWQAPDVP